MGGAGPAGPADGGRYRAAGERNLPGNRKGGRLTSYVRAAIVAGSLDEGGYPEWGGGIRMVVSPLTQT